LDRGLVYVTRVAVEVAGHVTDKPFPKSKAAGGSSRCPRSSSSCFGSTALETSRDRPDRCSARGRWPTSAYSVPVSRVAAGAGPRGLSRQRSAVGLGVMNRELAHVPWRDSDRTVRQPAPRWPSWLRWASRFAPHVRPRSDRGPTRDFLPRTRDLMRHLCTDVPSLHTLADAVQVKQGEPVEQTTSSRPCTPQLTAAASDHADVVGKTVLRDDPNLQSGLSPDASMQRGPRGERYG
jgi:hypothetical protein